MEEGAGRRRGTGAQLRRQLIKQARRLIESSSEDLSLRKVARASGVSEAAPYLYFKAGITELLAAVATVGFRGLLCAVKAARGQHGARSAIAEMGVRYVRFGVEHPNLYRVMFHAQLIAPLEKVMARERGPSDPDHQTYTTLQDTKLALIDAIYEPLSTLRRDGQLTALSPDQAVFVVASLAHGLVGSFVDEGLGRRPDESPGWTATREVSTRAALEVLLNGMTS
jgi:AcrR family transcriptional regulator